MNIHTLQNNSAVSSWFNNILLNKPKTIERRLHSVSQYFSIIIFVLSISYSYLLLFGMFHIKKKTRNRRCCTKGPLAAATDSTNTEDGKQQLTKKYSCIYRY